MVTKDGNNVPVFDFASGKPVPFGFEAFKYCNWMDISDWWLSHFDSAAITKRLTDQQRARDHRTLEQTMFAPVEQKASGWTHDRPG